MNKNKKIILIILIGAIMGAARSCMGKDVQNKNMMVNDKLKQVPHKQGFYEKYIKRPQDFCCALVAIIVLSPVLAITALLVRLRLGSPIIFKQERPGLNGEI